MNAIRPPFKADVVGSLLRPQSVIDGRARHAQGKITRQQKWDIETQAVEEAVALQKDVGLRVCTDGEFRRRHYFLDFLEQIEGLEVRGGIPLKFHNESGEVEFVPPRFEVVGKIERPHALSVDEFKSLKAAADRHGLTPKQSIPSPTCVHFRGGNAAVNKEAYPDIERFFADLARIYREEIADLYSAGCRYLQIDDTNFAFLCDKKLREYVRNIGEDPESLIGNYVQPLNACLKGRPSDMTVCLHMCRGNFSSSWMAEGGYEPIADAVFAGMNVDGFFLEFDSQRAGSFAPLKSLSSNKVAVLGLVTSKSAKLEPKDDLKRRIDEASRYVPLERLALSPQCGFASAIEGNHLSIDDEKRKLRLVVETAHEIWGQT